MKILMVHNRYELKGGEDAVFESECSLLRRRGHEVVEYLEDNRSIKERSRVSAAAAAIWSRRAHRSILRILEHGSFDIAHFHNIFLRVSPSAYYSCNKLGIPVVQTLHNYRLLCPSAELYRAGGVCESCLGKTAPWPAIWHACYRKSRLETSLIASILTLHNLANTWHRLIDRYIALTDFARTKFAEGGIPSRKISVKPNFVFPDPGMGDGQGDYALFVGRLTEQKGIKTLLNAWARLLHIPLRVVGEGPLADYVRRYSENGNLTHVQFLGPQLHRNVSELMKQARFLVFPSESYEGCPLALIESFACGVPVIASRVGSLQEIVEEERTGLYFERGSTEDLVRIADWAWRNPAAVRQMGVSARRAYEEEYSESLNYDQLFSIYQRTIREKTRSGES